MLVYYVEIIRYGSTKLGVQPYGIFDNAEKICEIMTEYNQFRGGKYPEYYISEINTNEFENCMGTSRRVRFEIGVGVKSSDNYD